MQKPLHPIQIQILKLLYNKKLTIYQISKELKIPTQLINYHVKSLTEKGLLIKEQSDTNRFVYFTNKDLIELKTHKNQDLLIIKMIV